MKLACWNVNSVRARQQRLVAWLEKTKPDVLFLQELKVTDEAFPYETLEALGYHAAVHAQKTYNGVAVLSRTKPKQITRSLGGGQMKVVAFIEPPQGEVIEKILRHCGLWQASAARAPTTEQGWVYDPDGDSDCQTESSDEPWELTYVDIDTFETTF